MITQVFWVYVTQFDLQCVTGLGSNHENEYHMGDDEISNEYHAIPGHTNNDQNPSSNYYIIPDPSKPSVEYTLVQKKKENPGPFERIQYPRKTQQYFKPFKRIPTRLRGKRLQQAVLPSTTG